jgi:SAM-dependent methyltransferase
VWNAGYISEIEYIFGYFSELSPTRLKLALLSRGIAHSVGDEPTYLELGFGQGLSLNINAVTSAGRFYGTDFNPSQAAHAAKLAQASGKDVTIFDQSFEELAQRDDLPEFDIIALHGIWSWISQGGRDAILDIVRRRLKPGGILYVSYNVTPGWSPAGPLRHLLSEYSKRAATGPILGRVDQSIAFVEKVIGADAAYFAANPGLADRLAQIKQQDRTYVTHEYFNAHWHPEPFAEIHDAFSEAKVSFGASASIIDNIEAVSVPTNARPVLEEIHDEVLRETVKDYFINQQFRRDIFVKGPRKMLRSEVAQAFRDMQFALLGDPAQRPKTVRTAAGEATLKESIYEPVVIALAMADRKPLSIDAIRQNPDCAKLTNWEVWEALLLLVGIGFVAPVAATELSAEDRAAALRLNREICRRARFSGAMQYLAAPLTGSAISVGRIEQLFLYARAEGEADIVEFVWKMLDEQGERLMIDGEPIEHADANRKRLAEMLETFLLEQVPVLRAVGAIADGERLF